MLNMYLLREGERPWKTKDFAVGKWNLQLGQQQMKHKNKSREDFRGGPVAENRPASAGDVGSIPGPETSHVPQSN